MNAKNKSAVGIDCLPYDVLKYPPIISLLHSSFQLVFDTGLIPFVSRQSVICHIHNDSTTDKRLPMDYRGISLLSCISILYSNLINKRLSIYLEYNYILAEEQNRFHRARSCKDHIITLNSIIRNNKQTFATFIDLKRFLISLIGTCYFINSYCYTLMTNYTTQLRIHVCIIILLPVFVSTENLLIGLTVSLVFVKDVICPQRYLPFL